MAVVGDEKGHVGVGTGKAKETLPSRDKAVRKAKLNIVKIKLIFVIVCISTLLFFFSRTSADDRIRVVTYNSSEVVPIYTNIGNPTLIQFEEDENGDGAFTSASEDMYSLQVTVDWVGWKMVSVKYSDIPCLVNGSPAAPNGEGTHQSNKIKTINMLHLANPNSGFAKAKLDYMIFTENAPLNP